MKSQGKDIKDQLKFICTSQNQKGLIKALLSKLNARYIGQIPSSVDVEDLTEAIQKKQYKVLQQSLEVLKIKVGLVKINLKEEFNQLQKENQSLKKKIKLLSKTVSIYDPMSLPFEDIKWSQQLKEVNIEIDQSMAKKTKQQGNYQYALLQVGFSADVKRKQLWAMKYKTKSNVKPLGLGIYLKKSAEFTHYDLECYPQSEQIDSQYSQQINKQYGGYFIASNGEYTGYYYDDDQLSFKFDEGDIIYFEQILFLLTSFWY